MVSSLFYETNMFGANKHNKLTNMVQYDILSTEQSQDQAKATTVATAKNEAKFPKQVKDAGNQGNLMMASSAQDIPYHDLTFDN